MVKNTKIMVKSPLVSVLMLTYNRGQFISEAINSVLSQTYRSLELIIIDDGSTDDTCLIINNFNDSRIEYIQHHENRGLAVRRAESATLAKGDFVAILDSDDIWIDEKKIAIQVAYMMAHLDCSIVGSFIKIIDKNGVVLGSRRFCIVDSKIRKNILIRNQFVHSSVLIRGSALKAVKGYAEIPFAEDLELFLKIGRNGEFSNIPTFMTLYRLHSNNESSKKILLLSYVLRIINKYKIDYPNSIFANIKYKAYILSLKILNYLQPKD
jgi:glycosyltransferase involved in cell wall biosynthesis